MGSQLPRLWPPSAARRPRRSPEQPLPAASRRRVRARVRRRATASCRLSRMSERVGRDREAPPADGRPPSAERPRTAFCFAMTEQSSDEAAPVHLTLVRSRPPRRRECRRAQPGESGTADRPRRVVDVCCRLAEPAETAATRGERVLRLTAARAVAFGLVVLSSTALAGTFSWLVLSGYDAPAAAAVFVGFAGGALIPALLAEVPLDSAPERRSTPSGDASRAEVRQDEPKLEPDDAAQRAE